MESVREENRRQHSVYLTFEGERDVAAGLHTLSPHLVKLDTVYIVILKL